MFQASIKLLILFLLLEICANAIEFSQFYFNDQDQQKTIWYFPAVNSKKSQAQARVQCKAIPGARLLLPTSQQQQEFIYTGGILAAAVNSTDMTNSWLASSVYMDATDSDVENVWVDEDKKQITFSAWRTDEPNGQAGENCGIILHEPSPSQNYKTWLDIGCASMAGYVCELRANHFQTSTSGNNEALYQCGSTACVTSGNYVESSNRIFCASSCSLAPRCGGFRFSASDQSCLLSDDQSTISTENIDMGDLCCFRI